MKTILTKSFGPVFYQKIFLVSLLAVAATTRFIFANEKEATGDFVAHEWGTFTSIQASDGGLLNW